jgi:hypothetical protein
VLDQELESFFRLDLHFYLPGSTAISGGLTFRNKV